jgi:hypothetical protein
MNKELTLLPGLPFAPGWTSLSQHDRDWLQEHTSNAVQNFRESGFKAIQACAELALIEKFLEGKPLTMTAWMKASLGSSDRTGWRWLANYKQMRGSVPDEAILYLAQEGVVGVNSAHQGAIVTAIKKLPPPKSTDRKSLEAWKEKVGEELSQHYRSNRLRSRRLDPDDAIRVFVTTGKRLLREAKITDSASQRTWLKKAIGYLMELRAITGTVVAERISVPEGYMPKVGFPRGKKRKKAA